MALQALFNGLPYWGVVLLTVLLVGSSVALGTAFGNRDRLAGVDSHDSSISTMVAAAMGLLALLLAFTFGFAADKLQQRKQLVLDEANSIGTTYLRARLLPQAESGRIQELLREYARGRVEAIRTGRIERGMAEAERLHALLWEQTERLAREHSGSVVLGTFIVSLNETIDAHESRVQVGVRDRVPLAIWLAIYLLAALAMGGMSYYARLMGNTSRLSITLLTAAFCVVILLIADLDRPGQGFLLVNQDPTADVLRSMMQQVSGP